MLVEVEVAHSKHLQVTLMLLVAQAVAGMQPILEVFLVLPTQGVVAVVVAITQHQEAQAAQASSS
jgi:hypothetical protein